MAFIQVLFESIHKHMLPLPTLVRQHKMKAAYELMSSLGAQAGVPEPAIDEDDVP